MHVLCLGVLDTCLHAEMQAEYLNQRQGQMRCISVLQMHCAAVAADLRRKGHRQSMSRRIVCYHTLHMDCRVPFLELGTDQEQQQQQLSAEAALHITAGQGILITPSVIGTHSEIGSSAHAALRAKLSF